MNTHHKIVIPKGEDIIYVEWIKLPWGNIRIQPARALKNMEVLYAT